MADDDIPPGWHIAPPGWHIAADDINSVRPTPGQSFDEWMTRFKTMCETQPVERFISRLDGLLLLYAYMENIFQLRFPEEYKAWRDKQDEQEAKG